MSVISMSIQTRREPHCPLCGEHLMSNAWELCGLFALCTRCTGEIRDEWFQQLNLAWQNTGTASFWSTVKGIVLFTPGPEFKGNCSAWLYAEHQRVHRLAHVLSHPIDCESPANHAI